jgi:hypothetical protein
LHVETEDKDLNTNPAPESITIIPNDDPELDPMLAGLREAQEEIRAEESGNTNQGTPKEQPKESPKQEPKRDDQKTQWRNAISGKAKQAGCVNPEAFHATICNRWPEWCKDGKLDWSAIDFVRYSSIMTHFENGAWRLDAEFEDDMP